MRKTRHCPIDMSHPQHYWENDHLSYLGMYLCPGVKDVTQMNTIALCDFNLPHGDHEWTDGHEGFYCPGIEDMSEDVTFEPSIGDYSDPYIAEDITNEDA